MSIKLQKIIRYIPGINLVSFFAWIFTAAKKKLRASYFLKTFLLMLALIVFAMMIGKGLTSFAASEIFSTVMFYFSLVLFTYIFAFISVSEQENIKNGKYEPTK